MSESPLTQLQQDALAMFFALPEAPGFMLAGGAALLATGLSSRPTQDIDLFCSNLSSGIRVAADAFEHACGEQGWSVERVQDTDTMRRLHLTTTIGELLVDLAVDSPPTGPPLITAYGPTFQPEELAARKLLALFDRAAARDFVDLFALASRFNLDQLLVVAQDLDEGFD